MSQHNLIGQPAPMRTMAGPRPVATLGGQYRALFQTHMKTLLRSPMALFLGIIFPVFVVFIGILAGKIVKVPKFTAGDSIAFPLGGTLLPKRALLPYVLQDSTSLAAPWAASEALVTQLIDVPTKQSPNFTRFDSLSAVEDYQRSEIIKRNLDKTYTTQQPVGGYFLRSPYRENGTGGAGNASLFNYATLYQKPTDVALPVLVHLMETAALMRSVPGATPVLAKLDTFPTQPSELTDISAQIIPIMFTYGLAFMITIVVFIQVQERELGIRNHLIASGVRLTAFYMSSLTRDLILYLVSALLGIIFLAAFRIKFFIDTSFLGFFLIIVFSGPDCLALGYIMAMLIKRTDNVASLAVLAITLIVFLPYLVIEVAFDGYVNLATSLILTTLVPVFGLNRGLRELAGAAAKGVPYSTADVGHIGYPILPIFLILVVKSVLLGALIIRIERRRLQGAGSMFSPRILWNRLRGPRKASLADTDTDAQDQAEELIVQDEEVIRERQRLQNLAADGEEALRSSGDIIQILGLDHTFPSFNRRPPLHILRNLWFSVRQNECFGYLGPNGAGKTTSMNILSGALRPSGGQAYIGPYSVVPYSEEIKSMIGICPQFDVLWLNLTAREHLRLFAAIRGLPSGQVEGSVNEIIQAMALGPVADQRCGGYSGGNKRRLSLGMACIGSPPVIFLDEPTTGVDVKVRLGIWEAIRHLKRTSAVVLTSHAMEEVEALCDRIGMIVNGNLKCLGTPQRLKNVYGRGWKVLVKASDLAHARVVTDHMMAQFHHPNGHRGDNFEIRADSINRTNCELVQQLGTNLEFEITRTNTPLATNAVPSSTAYPPSGTQTPSVSGSATDHSNGNTTGLLGPLFGLLETEKQNGLVLDYSVNQTTLSQVFIDFAKLQVTV
ncbi:hypothetical protein IWQ60_005567 [Tieghemiomyces parasiticus]|uniref:ABC transporter domain-containing protein n=1 Tax=Tieghemiomyces parasiticus TaxID=78921 RepID=A0A9W8AEE3_9FUNG|nr:hypothetical protein IWQ60_005567 [Tieghemiomyces parasiticus]